MALHPSPRPVRTLRHDVMRQAAGIAVSSLLVFLAAPGNGDWPLLAWIAFAPWFRVLGDLRGPAAALSGYAMGMAYIVPGHWSMFADAIAASGLRGPGLQALTALFFSIYALPFAVFASIDPWLRRCAGDRVILGDLARAGLLASLIGVFWAPFPYTPVAMIVDTPTMLQWAAIGGEPLLLWLVLWPSVVLGSIGLRPAHAATRLHAPGVVVIVLALVAVSGHWRMQAMDAARERGEGTLVSALPVQLDLPAFADGRLLTRDRADGRRSALELSRHALRQSPQCELVVWPETPVMGDALRDACARGPAIADSLGRDLLMHCARDRPEGAQLTVQWFAPGRGAVQAHAKSSLVPLYETPLLQSPVLTAGVPGEVFALPSGLKLVPSLCYELHSHDHLRAGRDHGGRVIVQMSSFTPFARHPIDRLDLGMGQIRAVEFAMPIIRAANRGTAGWIDVLGRRHVTDDPHRPNADCTPIWMPSRPGTPYAHIAGMADALLLLPALFLVFTRRRALH